MSGSQISIFGLLKQAALNEQLGHAILLVSPSLDSTSFQSGLRDFVSFLMCTARAQGSASQESASCGRCESCLAFRDSAEHEGVHPDFFYLRPDNRGGYAVDQIKELRSSLGLAKSIAAERVIVLENAEELGGGGGAPANALLKLLEEPRPNTRLILCSSRPEGILATIRSRCQLFRIPLPQGETMQSLLSSEARDSWAPLWQWIDSGFRAEQWTSLSLPPDGDAYFKERERATEELQAVFWEAWERARAVLGRLDTQPARDTLQWFEGFQELLGAFRFHGQGPLQWSAFKSRVRVGSL